MGRTRPDKGVCPTCGKAMTLVGDGVLTSHLRDLNGQRVHCPGSLTYP